MILLSNFLAKLIRINQAEIIRNKCKASSTVGLIVKRLPLSCFFENVLLISKSLMLTALHVQLDSKFEIA